jgi:5-methylcytosine-specific restriction endonuclease McrA
MPISLICHTCKQAFAVKPSHADRKYCCRSCELADASRKRHGLELPCAYCGTQFYVSPVALKRNKTPKYYCSRSCLLAAMKQTKPIHSCAYCGGTIRRAPSGIRTAQTNAYCSAKCRGKHQRGAAHTRWRGGTYTWRGPHWRKQSLAARTRDAFTCQRCGAVGVYVAAHHIIPYRISHDSSLDNLITLCRVCHTKTEVEADRLRTAFTRLQGL